MKKLILILIIIPFTGCLPATKAEIQDLTNSISQIVPVVREVVSTSSDDTKDKVEAILTKVGQVNEKVATAEGPVEAIEKGWKASEPFNPYYGYGAAILAALKLFFDNKKSKETEAKYAATKQGMDKFKNENPDKAAELYKDVGEARQAKKVA